MPFTPHRITLPPQFKLQPLRRLKILLQAVAKEH